MPADRDEAIDDYFAHSVDDDYSIDDMTLGGPHPATLAPVPLPDDDELVLAVRLAREAANGDSNDDEIEALQNALRIALARLKVKVKED